MTKMNLFDISKNKLQPAVPNMPVGVSSFEVKHSAKRSDMEKDCDKALAQIVKRQYAAEYEDEFDDILCYGISFYKKRCFVKVL